MKGFVGVTDNDWFAFLSQQPGIDEVIFWQPGGISWFRTERIYWHSSIFYNSGDTILNYVDIELPLFQEVQWKHRTSE